MPKHKNSAKKGLAPPRQPTVPRQPIKPVEKEGLTKPRTLKEMSEGLHKLVLDYTYWSASHMDFADMTDEEVDEIIRLRRELERALETIKEEVK